MKDVLHAFGLSADSKVTAIKLGLINTTYRVTDDVNNVLLQKINHHVFKNPAALQENYLAIYNHLNAKDEGFKIPELIKTGNDDLLFRDDNNEHWRAFRFIVNGFTFQSITDTSQAYVAAQCYASLSAQLSDLPFSTIHQTIPHFHDVSFRLKEFNDALKNTTNDNKQQALQEVETIVKYNFISDFYQYITVQPLEFRRYILHHDCKISNILFDKETMQVICPVDLDTTMPGYFFSDLGDMIRSLGNNFSEDSTDLNSMKLQKEIIEAVEQGYSEAMSSHLTSEENKWLPFSGHILTYMQALRFLSDFLNGNIYYQTNYSLHNLDRTKNQLQFLKLLMKWRQWPKH